MAALQLASCTIRNPSTKPNISSLSSTHRFYSCHSASSSNSSKIAHTIVGLRWQSPMLNKSSLMPGLRVTSEKPSLQSWNRGIFVHASNFSSEANTNLSSNEISALSSNETSATDGVKPFLGKSGSVSFSGLTHQIVEEGKMESEDFNKSAGSIFWLLGPIALIASMLLPRVVAIGLSSLRIDGILLEFYVVVFSELMFYTGLATFLFVTDRAQQPYLQFSPQKWGLITGYKGHLIYDLITSRIKLFSPILAAIITLPVVGIPALVSVTPFCAGCLAQIIFEYIVQRRKLSCGYLVPILFDIYRFFQLNRAGRFLDRLMFAFIRVPTSTGVMQTRSALTDLVIFLQLLSVVCLWSLLTYLPRLLPSRTVVPDN